MQKMQELFFCELPHQIFRKCRSNFLQITYSSFLQNKPKQFSANYMFVIFAEYA